jgi:hypothetical protein
MTLVRTLALALVFSLAARPAAAQVVPAAGWAASQIPTPGTVQGGVVRQGDAILVGQGSFGVGSQQVIRLDTAGATTIATGFNSLGGFALDAAGTLWVVDNGGNLAGAATGDTVFAIPDALTRTTAVTALGQEVLPAGTIPFAMDALVLPDASLLVSDAVGPGAGRVVRVGGSPAALTGFATGLDFLGGLALAADETVLVANLDGTFVGAVLAYAGDGTPLGTVAGGLSGAFALAVDNDGHTLVSGGFTGDFSSSTVMAIAPDGAVTERARGFAFTGELFHDATRDELLVLDFGASHVDAICRDRDGDGVCDADDDCPAAADPGQTDTDGDGLGDACDPCTDGIVVATPKLVIAKISAPAGDEALAFTGELPAFPASPPLDPVATGARVRIADTAGALLDVTIPGGAFDETTKRGWKVKDGGFKYVNRAGTEGIVAVKVKPSAKVPGLVVFGVHGKKGTWAVDPSRLPLAGTFAVDTAAGQCGDAAFPGPAPVCVHDPVKAKVKCK